MDERENKVGPGNKVDVAPTINYTHVSVSLFGFQRVEMAHTETATVRGGASKDAWYKRPLGLIIIGVITGVIVAVIGTYVLRALLLK